MSFLHPEFLYFMLPPLFILFGLLLTQKEAQADFFSDEVLQKLRVSANTLTLKARNALFFLIGFLMILSLSQPVIDEGAIEVKAKSADIMIALDISDSMLAGDLYPNRLEFAKHKAKEFLKLGAKKERFGMIAFAKNSYLVSPLSFDTDVVRFLLEKLGVSSITEKGTDFLSMFDVVQKTLEKEGEKYLLIFSDGGDQEDFSREIAHAKEHGIRVFILSFGTSKGAPVRDKKDLFIKDAQGNILITKRNDKVAELATATGGVYIEALKSNEDIAAMYREILRVADAKEVQSQTIHRYIPLFYFPLGLALLLLLFAMSSMSKRQSVHVPSVALFFALLFVNPSAEALVLDFLELEKGKKAYETGDYAQAAEVYAKHAQETQNSYSHYNAGNAYYKQGEFEKAIGHYENTRFHDKELQAKNYANLGNAHAKLSTPEGLHKAKENYEKSLKLVEDKEVAENLDAVKKALEEQKKEEQTQENKNDKNQEKNKNEQQEGSQNKEQQDSKGKNEADESEQNSKEQNQSSKEQKHEQEQKNKEQKPQNAAKETNENNVSMPSKETKPSEQKMQMSDEEFAKWLARLNEKSNTFLYRLNDAQPPKEDPNAKPW